MLDRNHAQLAMSTVDAHRVDDRDLGRHDFPIAEPESLADGSLQK